MYENIHLLNFRDLGGKKGADGKHIRYGLLFRSAQPNDQMDEETKRGLEELHLDYVFDLRDEKATIRTPNYPIPGTTYVNSAILEKMDPEATKSPIEITSIEATLDGGKITRKEAKRLHQEFLRMYREMPFSAGFQPIFDAMKEHKSFLVHCQGGKDRTGLSTIFILKTLGVDDETIYRDYILSNKMRAKKNRWRFRRVWKKSHSLVAMKILYQVLICTREDYLSTIHSIEDRYGDFFTYLEKQFGVSKEDVEDMRAYYLE